MWRRSGRAALAAALAIALVPAAPAARQHEESPGAILETPEAMRVTTVIQCFCGTCVNQTLHDCTCGTAARERRLVQDAIDAGRSPDEIIAAYVTDHGEQVRIVPLRTGLNLVGWAVPFVAAAAGLMVLTVLLLAWRRRAPAAAGPEPGAAPDAPEYRARLAKDLKEFDSW